MPLIGNKAKCERCRESKPRWRLRFKRVRLMNGPNGERLCPRHHQEAWDEYMKGTKP